MQVQGTAALAVAAMAALGSSHTGARQGSEGAQGTATGARARVGRGAQLWCKAGILGVEEVGGRLTAGEAQRSVIGME